MTTAQLHVIVGAAFSTAVGYVMVRIGIGTKQLLPRNTRRNCAYCGRKLSSGSCDHCGR
jgi:hypothetical protein